MVHCRPAHRQALREVRDDRQGVDAGGGGAGGGGGGAGSAILLPTSELAPEVAERVDRNGDGVVDYLDVELFEFEHDLPNTLSTLMKPGRR